MFSAHTLTGTLPFGNDSQQQKTQLFEALHRQRAAGPAVTLTPHRGLVFIVLSVYMLQMVAHTEC